MLGCIYVGAIIVWSNIGGNTEFTAARRHLQIYRKGGA